MTKIAERLATEDIRIAESANAKEKTCRRCGVTKIADAFGLFIQNETAYLHSWCKECRKKAYDDFMAVKRECSPERDYSRKLKCLTCEYEKIDKCAIEWSQSQWNALPSDDARQ